MRIVLVRPGADRGQAGDRGGAAALAQHVQVAAAGEVAERHLAGGEQAVVDLPTGAGEQGVDGASIQGASWPPNASAGPMTEAARCAAIGWARMGPLAGVRVVEVAGIGPGPFCAMLLADLGAEVVRVDRTAGGRRRPGRRPRFDVLSRGRRSVAVDLKHAGGAEVVLRLVERADALLEGFRPGVAERLGIGPDACLARNPPARLRADDRLGPGRARSPTPPATTSPTPRWPAPWPTSAGPTSRPPRRSTSSADFGGGGMLLALGLRGRRCSTRSATGEGQVVDAAMVDGTALLMAPFFGASAIGLLVRRAGHQPARLRRAVLRRLPLRRRRWSSRSAPSSRSSSPPCSTCSGSTAGVVPDQNDQARWPELRAVLAWADRRPPRAEWLAAGRGPRRLPGARADDARGRRSTRTSRPAADDRRAGRRAPAGARPRGSRPPPPTLDRPPAVPGQHTDEVLADWGFSADERRRAPRRGRRRLSRLARRRRPASDDVLETTGTRSTFRGRGPGRCTSPTRLSRRRCARSSAATSPS